MVFKGRGRGQGGGRREWPRGLADGAKEKTCCVTLSYGMRS